MLSLFFASMAVVLSLWCVNAQAQTPPCCQHRSSHRTAPQLPPIQRDRQTQQAAYRADEAGHGSSRGGECAGFACAALRHRRAEHCRRRRRAAHHGEPDDGDRAGSQRPPGGAAGRDSRSRARPRRGHARRRRQGQSILSARLQSRSRHGSGDLRRRHADQSAVPCSRPGLRRPQLADAADRRQPEHPQGTLLRRRRRFRHRGLAVHQSARQRRQDHRARPPSAASTICAISAWARPSSAAARCSMPAR